MSSGGVFTLISNDGKADRMLMATDLLRERLLAIQNARALEGVDDTPTLNDIEKTHILFMNAHFKPFAAIGFEYNKVRPQSGNTTLNASSTTTIQFSIPQFGDFFYDMTLHIKLTGAAMDTQAWRWCEYPGERLLRRVSFTVNGNPLDTYYSEDYNFKRKFHVAPGKRAAWDRCVGQQCNNLTQVEQINANTAYSSLNMPVSSGWQTVKVNAGHQAQETDDLEMCIPLLFWCNEDVRLAVPSVSIPYGQRFIDMDLEQANLLVGGQPTGGQAMTGGALTVPTVSTLALYINNIFVNPEIHDIYIKRVGFNLIRVHRRQSTRVNAATGEVLLNSLKWPIEYLHVGFRPVENITPYSGTDDATYAEYAERVLADWHRYCKVSPLRLISNALLGHGPANAQFRYKYYMNAVSQISIKAQGINIYSEFPQLLFSAYTPYQYGGYNISSDYADDNGAMFVPFCLHPGTYQPSGHINVSRTREFYLAYVGNNYTNAAGTAFPLLGSTAVGDGTNGASNMAAATTGAPNFTSGDTPADLIVCASALNFLLISDGSAVLRYST